jgi:hypothetical protein
MELNRCEETPERIPSKYKLLNERRKTIKVMKEEFDKVIEIPRKIKLKFYRKSSSQLKTSVESLSSTLNHIAISEYEDNVDALEHLDKDKEEKPSMNRI